MSAEKSVEKLPSSTNPAANNFVSSDADNCINNIRRFEKNNAKKHRNNLNKHYGFLRIWSHLLKKSLMENFIFCAVKLQKGYSLQETTLSKTQNHIKRKKSTKYVTTVKSIPGATTEGMIPHVKACVDFAPDMVLLQCGTNDFKKDLTPQKIAQTY